MKQIINLTPHDVNIVSEDGKEIKTFAGSQNPARCSVETEKIGEINNITLTKTAFGEVENLPESEENIYFIVSRLVASACDDRNDLLIPNETVRDENGNIIGCRSLAKL